MRGGRWKRPSPAGPPRRGLEARPRSISAATTCLGRSGVCKERQSWSQSSKRTPPTPPAISPKHTPGTFVLSLVGAAWDAITTPEGHFFTSCPYPGGTSTCSHALWVGNVVSDGMGEPLNAKVRRPMTLPAHQCRRPPHVGLPSSLSPSPSCPQRVSSGPWRRPWHWG